MLTTHFLGPLGPHPGKWLSSHRLVVLFKNIFSNLRKSWDLESQASNWVPSKHSWQLKGINPSEKIGWSVWPASEPLRWPFRAAVITGIAKTRIENSRKDQRAPRPGHGYTRPALDRGRYLDSWMKYAMLWKRVRLNWCYLVGDTYTIYGLVVYVSIC